MRAEGGERSLKLLVKVLGAFAGAKLCKRELRVTAGPAGRGADLAEKPTPDCLARSIPRITIKSSCLVRVSFDRVEEGEGARPGCVCKWKGGRRRSCCSGDTEWSWICLGILMAADGTRRRNGVRMKARSRYHSPDGKFRHGHGNFCRYPDFRRNTGGTGG